MSTNRPRINSATFLFCRDMNCILTLAPLSSCTGFPSRPRCWWLGPIKPLIPSLHACRVSRPHFSPVVCCVVQVHMYGGHHATTPPPPSHACLNTLGPPKIAWRAFFLGGECAASSASVTQQSCAQNLHHRLITLPGFRRAQDVHELCSPSRSRLGTGWPLAQPASPLPALSI